MLYLFNYILPLTILVLSIFITYTKSPIYALICLISVVFQFIFILITHKIDFLPLVLLIVYIGAISILFLFVIMMFNLQDLVYNYVRNWKEKLNIIYLIFLWLPTLKLYYIFTSKLNYFLFINYAKIKNINSSYLNNDDVSNLNAIFYTQHWFIFYIGGCILLFAMIGAIILALTTNLLVLYNN